MLGLTVTDGPEVFSGGSVMLNEIAIAAAIVSVCLMIHLTGILLIAEWLFKWREAIDRSPAEKSSRC